MPAHTDYRAGARVYITLPASDFAYDELGLPTLTDQRSVGTIIGTHGPGLYWVQPDLGEKMLVKKGDLVVVDERRERRNDGALTIVLLAILGLIGYSLTVLGR